MKPKNAALIGKTLVVEARIYPNEIPNYSGPYLRTYVKCKPNKTRVYSIKNEGNQPFIGSPINRIIIEDYVQFKNVKTININTLTIPPNTEISIDSTSINLTNIGIQRIDIPQVAGFPYGTRKHTSANLDGCNTTNTLSDGVYLEYPIDDEEPFRHLEAWEVKNVPTIEATNTGKYVSEMYAKTKGIDSAYHYVTKEPHKIDYSVVLYNGSQDTIREIKMLDTLNGQYFDLKTIAFTGTTASKAVDFSFSDTSLVKVDFGSNELFPNKFMVCAFSVSLKNGIANKTKIINKAHYTFEKNDASKISKSSYFHTINDSLFVPTQTISVFDVNKDRKGLINAVIYPNPFSSKAILLIENENNIPLGKAKIFNVTGISLKTIPIENENMVEIDAANLQKGFYFLTIYDDKNRALISKKFVVE